MSQADSEQFKSVVSVAPRDRAFGLAVYSALVALAMAFRRRYVGDDGGVRHGCDKCPHCQALTRL